ncbi:MAG: glycoside hydrolase family 5 protein [Chloroflexi bacterium]|nr:MAG: glycoside hydrolase family 5 protein [Chloroflexota bacterium]
MATVLRVSGGDLVAPDGRPVRLRGVGLGGWMNMENFITGFPGTETALREALAGVLGEELAGRLFDRFLETFFGPDDARHLGELGLNLVRLPVNYRHFEDDLRPFEIREEGFRHLDRVIEACAAAGLYTIVDLHALPGGQNQEWHADNRGHEALFWRHRHFQDRAVNLWRVIATRYRDNPWVAGYNPINEPADPSGRRLVEVSRRLVDAIREHDPDHVIFLEGNRFSTDFEMFGETWPNVVYTTHDYALPGHVDGGPYPGVTRGRYVDRDALERTFLERTRYMRETGTPIWVGEFGPVYTGDPERDQVRYRILQDQLEIYERYGASWAIWTYKDVGVQGLVHADPESAWMRRVGPVLERKRRLGVDRWASLDTGVRPVLQPLEDLVAAEFPDYEPYPYGRRWLVHRLVRHILLAEAMMGDFAGRFAGATAEDVEELADSFRLERCVRRTPLEELLRRFAPIEA